jgi:hypothetical protein
LTGGARLALHIQDVVAKKDEKGSKQQGGHERKGRVESNAHFVRFKFDSNTSPTSIPLTNETENRPRQIQKPHLILILFIHSYLPLVTADSACRKRLA